MAFSTGVYIMNKCQLIKVCYLPIQLNYIALSNSVFIFCLFNRRFMLSLSEVYLENISWLFLFTSSLSVNLSHWETGVGEFRYNRNIHFPTSAYIVVFLENSVSLLSSILCDFICLCVNLAATCFVLIFVFSLFCLIVSSFSQNIFFLFQQPQFPP